MVPRGSSCRGWQEEGGDDDDDDDGGVEQKEGKQEQRRGGELQGAVAMQGGEHTGIAEVKWGAEVKRKSQLESGELKGWLCAGK